VLVFGAHHLREFVILGLPPNPRPALSLSSYGTADLPVAEEAAVTAGTIGSGVQRLGDVGVAGIHRLVE